MSHQQRSGREDNGRFGKGQSGNPAGRGGVPNKTTREVKSFAIKVLEDPRYVASLWRRIKKDTLPPAVEVLLYYYAYGKPKERLEVSGEKTLVQLVTEAATLTADQAAALLQGPVRVAADRPLVPAPAEGRPS